MSYTTLAFDLNGAPNEAGMIVVRDAAGKIVQIVPMKGSQGQVVLDTRQLVPGSYLVEFTDGANLLHTEKLQVQQ